MLGCSGLNLPPFQIHCVLDYPKWEEEVGKGLCSSTCNRANGNAGLPQCVHAEATWHFDPDSCSDLLAFQVIAHNLNLLEIFAHIAK